MVGKANGEPIWFDPHELNVFYVQGKGGKSNGKGNGENGQGNGTPKSGQFVCNWHGNVWHNSNERRSADHSFQERGLGRQTPGYLQFARPAPPWFSLLWQTKGHRFQNGSQASSKRKRKVAPRWPVVHKGVLRRPGDMKLMVHTGPDAERQEWS